MDWRAIRRHRRLLLAGVAAFGLAALIVGVLFGRRWRQELFLRALASADDGKSAWAKNQLQEQSDEGIDLLLAHLGRRGEAFDLRAADYFEERGHGGRLPVELRVRSAAAKLTDPVLGRVGLARLMELPPEALEPLLAQARNLPGPALRGAALASVTLDQPGAREQALLHLGQEDPKARRLGLAIIGACGDEALVADVQPLVSDPDPSVRAEAVHSLALLQGRAAFASLVPLLVSDASEAVRCAVLGAILMVGKPQDGGLLLPALRDQSESVRAQAVLALGSLASQEQTEGVCSLAQDPSPRVRQAVALALAAPGGDLAISTLLALSQDEVPKVRQAAAETLGRKVSCDRAFSALFQLANDESPSVAQSAYWSLVQSRRREVIPFFIAQLSNGRASWALDPLPAEIAGARPRPVPLGALANCALCWLTGKDFGYHWRAPAQERQAAQKRWQHWLATEGQEFDPTQVSPPEGLANYEEFLRRMPWPPESR